jgi:hypothetical protein
MTLRLEQEKEKVMKTLLSALAVVMLLGAATAVPASAFLAPPLLAPRLVIRRGIAPESAAWRNRLRRRFCVCDCSHRLKINQKIREP